MQQYICNETNQLSILLLINYIAKRNKCGACKLFGV